MHLHVCVCVCVFGGMKIKERASHSGLGLSIRRERCYLAKVSRVGGPAPKSRLRTGDPEGGAQPWGEEWCAGSLSLYSVPEGRLGEHT